MKILNYLYFQNAVVNLPQGPSTWGIFQTIAKGAYPGLLQRVISVSNEKDVMFNSFLLLLAKSQFNNVFFPSEHNCFKDSQCVNLPATYKCDCPDGWYWYEDKMECRGKFDKIPSIY